MKLELACKAFAKCVELMNWCITMEQIMMMERPLYFERQIYLPVIVGDFTIVHLN